METIHAHTKRGKAYLEAYNRSKDYMLRCCYKNYSTAKGRAEYECYQKMQDEEGRGFRIISHNCFYFSCGWIVGNEEYPYGLRVETPYKSILVQFD